MLCKTQKSQHYSNTQADKFKGIKMNQIEQHEKLLMIAVAGFLFGMVIGSIAATIPIGQ